MSLIKGLNRTILHLIKNNLSKYVCTVQTYLTKVNSLSKIYSEILNYYCKLHTIIQLNSYHCVEHIFKISYRRHNISKVRQWERDEIENAKTRAMKHLISTRFLLVLNGFCHLPHKYFFQFYRKNFWYKKIIELE